MDVGWEVSRTFGARGSWVGCGDVTQPCGLGLGITDLWPASRKTKDACRASSFDISEVPAPFPRRESMTFPGCTAGEREPSLRSAGS